MADELTKEVDAIELGRKAKEVATKVAVAADRVDLVFAGAAKASVIKAKSDTETDIVAAQRAAELGFPIVEKTKETRKVQVQDPRYSICTATVPIVWVVELPAKQRKVTVKDHPWKITASIPLPPTEALDAIEQHAHKFDAIEMWWVPCDLEFERMPDPDPIIIGVIKGGSVLIYCELYRWIDETVEDPYFNAVAY